MKVELGSGKLTSPPVQDTRYGRQLRERVLHDFADDGWRAGEVQRVVEDHHELLSYPEWPLHEEAERAAASVASAASTLRNAKDQAWLKNTVGLPTQCAVRGSSRSSCA